VTYWITQTIKEGIVQRNGMSLPMAVRQGHIDGAAIHLTNVYEAASAMALLLFRPLPVSVRSYADSY